MAYIGNVPAEKYTALTRQTFSSPTGTSHTLSHSVTNSDDLLLYINNVKQDPADYTASGTNLTTPTLVSGDEMYALFYGRATETISPPDSSVSLAKLTASGTASSSNFLRGDNSWATPTDNGKVLQVVSTTKTDTFSDTNGTTWSDVTGLSVAITPSATSSKILVQWSVWLGTSTAANNCYIRVLRDSTAISIGDTASNRNRTSGGGVTYYTSQWILASGIYLDSPSTTSATTFKIQIASQGSITKYVNRSGWDDDVNWAVGRTPSTITVMEIGV
jgi:hypothetical protein